MASKATLEVVANPGERTIVFHRVLDAPAALVWEAWTRPEHLRRWWGPRRHELVVCELDLRVGGRWRFVLRDRDGHEAAFRGEYREIVPCQRIVATFVFEPMPDHVAEETLVFEEHGGKTTIRSTVVHASVEARDGHLANGMEEGARETYERLDELLLELGR